MREPAVLRRSVPVLYAGRDIHDVAGIQLARLFSVLLIPSATRDTDEYLSAAFVGYVNVPVVAAARQIADVRRQVDTLRSGERTGLWKRPTCSLESGAR